MPHSCIKCQTSPANSTHTTSLCIFCANETHLAYEAETGTLAVESEVSITHYATVVDKYAAALILKGALSQEEDRQLRIMLLEQERKLQIQDRRSEALDQVVLEKDKELQVKNLEIFVRDQHVDALAKRVGEAGGVE